MSLVTRCPACSTTFKVVRDQLRISDGWVRCGRCSAVFDAMVDLNETDETVAAVVEPVPPVVAEAVVAQPEAVVAVEPAVAVPEIALPEGAVMADEPWPEPPVHPMPVAAVNTPSFPDLDFNLAMPALPSSGSPSLTEPPPDNAQLQKALRDARKKSVAQARAARAGKAQVFATGDATPVVQVASEPEATMASGGLVASAPIASRPVAVSRFVHWLRLRGGRSLLLTGGVLAVVLVVQVLRHERDLIAARQPSLRPMLETLCQATGCELSALRRISDIVIDGASFAREQGGEGYRLNFTLRNQAALPLAMPAVELTLLDTRERPVVRRVLAPFDFDAPPVLPARAEHVVSLPVALNGPEAASLPPVVGFGVAALYP